MVVMVFLAKRFHFFKLKGNLPKLLLSYFCKECKLNDQSRLQNVIVHGKSCYNHARWYPVVFIFNMKGIDTIRFVSKNNKFLDLFTATQRALRHCEIRTSLPFAVVLCIFYLLLLD